MLQPLAIRRAHLDIGDHPPNIDDLLAGGRGIEKVVDLVLTHLVRRQTVRLEVRLEGMAGG